MNKPKPTSPASSRETSPSLSRPLFALLLVAVASPLACKRLVMKMPTELQKDAEVHKVTDENNSSGLWGRTSFTAGPYRVSNLQRKEDSRELTLLSAIATDDRKKTPVYYWDFQGQKKAGKGECKLQDQEVKGKWLTVRHIAVLDCKCNGADFNSKLTVAKEMDSPEGWKGQATAGDLAFELRQLDEFEGGVKGFKNMGMEARAPDGAAGAVVFDEREFYLRRSIEPAKRDGLACLLGAIYAFNMPGSGFTMQ